MPTDFKRVRYKLPKLPDWKYRILMKTLQNSLIWETSDVAQYRLHVLNHYYRYGLHPTMDAFNVKKSTLYDWRKSYEQHHKRIIGLVPTSTKPKSVRAMETDWRLIEFIKEMRNEHGNIGQNIIKPFIDVYAKELGISTIGLTTIAKIIKRRHFTFEERHHIRRAFKFKKLRTRKSPKVKEPGFIQMDSIVVYINKEKYLFMSVIDIYTKFALVRLVPTISSKQAHEVFSYFQTETPTTIHTVQTDNGSEFLSVFHEYLEKEGILHQFIYPGMPRINGVVERFNRTIQEEFILRNDEIYYDIEAFQGKLVQYLQWYNEKRPHASLSYLSPLTFISTKIPKS